MKIGRRLFFLIIIFLLWYYFNRVTLTGDVVVKKWDTYQVFFDNMWLRDRLMLKTYLTINFQSTPPIYPWVFRFDKPVTYRDFIKTVAVAPKSITTKITLLEWRSSFDNDALIARKWFSPFWSYRSYVTNKETIDLLRQTYTFLPEDISTLEWYLYPDTYFIDLNKWDIVPQLVKLQLNAFYDKVWWPDPAMFTEFSKKLASDGFVFKMSPYSIVKLASIIENEEKNNQNKQTIAWLFLNRIAQGMLLGADVTLCYGLQATYDKCTPSFIVDHLVDTNNPYNTRKVWWLPPTPISNPSIKSFASVLTYKKTPYLYYLHDSEWTIHYWSTLEEHNRNKTLFLR